MPPLILERGHVRLALIRDLAGGEHTGAKLAKKYGVCAQAISEFKRRHEAAIAEVRGKLDDEFAGLWVARKAARLAEYENDLLCIQEAIELAAEAAGDDAPPPVPADLLRAKHRALRAVAEELGQLPTRMDVQVSGEVVHYAFGGDDEAARAMTRRDDGRTSDTAKGDTA